MQVGKISVIPTERKIKKAKQMVAKSGILPRELPVAKSAYETTGAATMNRIKDSILISIDNMRRQ